MYGTKCLLVGLFAGMAIGASSSLVQRHLRTMCDCAKNTVNCANKQLDKIQNDVKEIDIENLKTAIDQKIDEFKEVLTTLKENLSKEELSKSIQEMSSKITNLFQEFGNIVKM